MPVTFPRERIRIEVDVSAASGSDSLMDVITKETPDMWKGTAVQFELAFFYQGALMDLSNIATITLTGKPSEARRAAALLGPKSTSSFNNSLSQAEWEAGTNQHCTISFDGDETDVDMLGDNERDLFIILTGTTNDSDPLPLAFGSATLKMFETGVSGTQPGNAPIAGGNIIPNGAVYDGSGHYLLAVTSARIYEYTKSTHDTSITNGTETVSASGRFTTQTTSITLNGSAGLSVTAFLRNPLFYTADEVTALIANQFDRPVDRLILVSPDGTKQRIRGVNNDGSEYSHYVNLSAAP